MQNQCICGKQFTGMCRIIALEQQMNSGNSYHIDTSRLTNDPEENKRLLKDKSAYIKDEEHGLKYPIQYFQSPKKEF